MRSNRDLVRGRRRRVGPPGDEDGSGTGGQASAPTEGEDPEEAFARALERSFRLLAVRGRSVGEVSTRLRQAGFEDATVERVVLRLGELRYLDDADFARQWVAERGAGARASGRMRLQYDLAQKGIPRAVISEAMQAYTHAHEQQAALSVCRALAARTAGVPAEKARRQAYQGLVRRGFEREAILRAVSEVFGQPGSE